MPYTDMGEEEEGEEPVPKRRKLSSKRGVRVLTVPSSQVKKHEGGRGRKRMQLKKGKYKYIIHIVFYVLLFIGDDTLLSTLSIGCLYGL